jgi:hypothetical protein
LGARNNPGLHGLEKMQRYRFIAWVGCINFFFDSSQTILKGKPVFTTDHGTAQQGNPGLGVFGFYQLHKPDVTVYKTCPIKRQPFFFAIAQAEVIGTQSNAYHLGRKGLKIPPPIKLIYKMPLGAY